jgi:hypothetical protein
MDDIDTRLEAERPEVAGVLRSMNWEERLEQARARRQAVLERNTSDDKRPVVRIIDAAAVARKRADTQPLGPARPAAVPDARPVAAPEPEAAAPPPPDALAAAAPPPGARASTAGRTAMGFGLGLGIGASLVAGAFLLLGLPGAPTPPSGSASAVAPAAAPQRPAPAASPAAPAPRVSAALPPDLAPPAGGVAPLLAAFAPGPAGRPAPAGPSAAGPDTAPLMVPIPGLPVFARLDLALLQGGESFATPVLAAFAPGPAGRPAPAGPASLAPDTTPRTVALPAQPAVVPVVIALAAPAVPAGAATAPARVAAAAGIAQRASGSFVVPDAGPNATPRVEAATSRPAAGLVPEAPPGAAPAFAGVDVPADVPSPVLAALPAAPAAAAPSERGPAASLLPPAPMAEAPAPDIPGAAAKFVRLAVPQSVGDAEAEEIAGLLKDLGIGDSRVTRVGYKVSESHVRYYHRDDAPAAAALAAILGTSARDHTAFRPRPPDGTMEVFLAGEPTTPAPRVASAPKRAAPAQATRSRPQAQPRDETAAMRDRIVNRLRRGEHL